MSLKIVKRKDGNVEIKCPTRRCPYWAVFDRTPEKFRCPSCNKTSIVFTKRNDLTVVYYSSNREKPKFEEMVTRSLRDASNGLPIISVSQKPMDLGENICVGEKDASIQNAWRQMQVGAEAAKTKYVCTAESDFLYSDEYFKFVPKSDICAYTAYPLYVCYMKKGIKNRFYLMARGTQSAMIIGREHLINSIERALKNVGRWGPEHTSGGKIEFLLKVVGGRGVIRTKVPTVNFKTDENMHRRVPLILKSECEDLPHWGNVHDLVKKYQG
jgi:hypothetical protein